MKCIDSLTLQQIT